MVAVADVRISHPIKGRIPEAIHKKSSELLEHEKTIYYERVAFIIELANVYQNIDGSLLKQTGGGVKSFSQDNLYGNKSAGETFHIFIGFQNTICTNLCIWTDGLKQKVKVKSVGELLEEVENLFQQYDAVNHITAMERFTELSLSEKQFAQLIGRSRLYNYLPPPLKTEVTPLQLSDKQVGIVARAYYSDDDFQKEEDGSITLESI